MIRLAILGSRGIPATYGGFEVVAERIAKGLVERGWQVTVFCPHNQAYRGHAYDGIALRRVWHPPGGIGTLVYDGLSLLIASAGRFDAILMFGYGAGPFFLIPRLFRTPIVVNTDGLEWKRSKWSGLVKLYFRFADMERDLDEPNLRTPSHDFIDFAYRWSSGEPLDKIPLPPNIDIGDAIKAMKALYSLLRQLEFALRQARLPLLEVVSRLSRESRRTVARPCWSRHAVL